MAKYTMQLRHVAQAMESGGWKFDALDTYPIFDEQYREILNSKILDYYWLHEIAHETPGMFNHRLGITMRMIMPYYNELYQSKLIEFDPIQWGRDIESFSGKNVGDGDVLGDITVTGNNITTDILGETSTSRLGSTQKTTLNTMADTVGKNTGTRVDTQENKKIHSEFPQNQIEIGDMENGIYANDGEWDNNRLNSDETSEVKNTVKNSGDNTVVNSGQDEVIRGGKNENTSVLKNNTAQSSANKYRDFSDWLRDKKYTPENPSDSLAKLRENIINIDELIINRIANMFFMLW